MKTVEEIYEEGGYDGNVDKERVCYMMKEYAKIEAIAFAKDLHNFYYEDDERTIEELYQLYQDNKNQVI